MKNFLVIVALVFSVNLFAQKHVTRPPVDTAFTDYNALFSEMDIFLDEFTRPRSFAMFNLGIGSSYFDFSPAESSSNAVQKIRYSPSLSYFHKSGFGVTGESAIVHDGSSLNPYQFSVTGSYDFLKNRRIITGVSLTHYFTKEDLPFYISPLQNEAMAYVTYRKGNLRPSISVQYGWGSEEAYVEQQQKVKDLKTTQTITTQNNISDFSINTSLRYNFYLLDILSQNDYLKITPQVSLVSGTQRFGFNQVNTVFTHKGNSPKNASQSSESVVSNNSISFQPLSFTAFLKTEYARGKFFIQPQVFLDYYFPSTQNNMATGFLINTGVIF